GPTPVPKRQLHRSQPQRAQQFRNGRQDLGRSDVTVARPDQWPEGALLTVGLRNVKLDRRRHQPLHRLVGDQPGFAFLDRALAVLPEPLRRSFDPVVRVIAFVLAVRGGHRHLYRAGTRPPAEGADWGGRRCGRSSHCIRSRATDRRYAGLPRNSACARWSDTRLTAAALSGRADPGTPGRPDGRSGSPRRKLRRRCGIYRFPCRYTRTLASLCPGFLQNERRILPALNPPISETASADARYWPLILPLGTASQLTSPLASYNFRNTDHLFCCREQFSC